MTTSTIEQPNHIDIIFKNLQNHLDELELTMKKIRHNEAAIDKALKELRGEPK